MRRVNLLHAHGSPSSYLYNNHGCRCAACRGQRAAYGVAYRITHREERAASNAAYYVAHREELAAYHAAYRITHCGEIAAYNITHRKETSARHQKRKYGFLPGEWDAMFAAQDNSCAICGADDPGSRQGWHTDHDHGTGVVRGILCHGCNIGLGGFRDDPARLMAASEYLEATP